ncbi:GIY-YIG nuclease family protein [Corynebacterium auris]|uniref:GIY-YIG nuclease family protein n=1 Tax=Corynebacterium auris TaxID=44750 RepID=UPI0025B4E919|nr:GIY-YIG nuclease family protein [Corynebacterium auris]WJY67456.1 hypothetical protein CAURIS_02660 [Corynebacterium auris]
MEAPHDANKATGETSPTMTFTSWPVRSGDSLAPLIASDRRRGIYVLEFEDGSRYVGKATNVLSRFNSHVHGSRHHGPWGDIVAVLFREVAEGDLDVEERLTIRYFRDRGLPLRNRTGVPESVTESPLEQIIAVEKANHWSLGETTDCHQDFTAHAMIRTPRTRLAEAARKDVYEAVVADLAYAIEFLIPSAQTTERSFWTLSDYPSTAGGRYATLNTGTLEFLVFPRNLRAMDIEGWPGHLPDKHPVGYLNVFISEDVDWSDHDVLSPTIFGFDFTEYDSVSCDTLYYPVGSLEQLLKAHPELVQAARTFSLTMMRFRRSGLFARWHSTPLTQEVYSLIGHKQWTSESPA